MGQFREAFDHGVEDLVGAEASGVLETRLHYERKVPVPPLQASDDGATADGDREQVGGHLGDVRLCGQAHRCGRAQLEYADQVVPEHEGRQNGSVEAAIGQMTGGLVGRERSARVD